MCRMRLGRKDSGGRNKPIRIKGSEFRLETDLVIAAVGEQPDLDL